MLNRFGSSRYHTKYYQHRARAWGCLVSQHPVIHSVLYYQFSRMPLTKMTCWQIQGGGSGDRDFSVGGRDRIRTCLNSCHNRLRSGSLCVGATDLAGLGSR